MDVRFNRSGKIKVYDICNVLEVHTSGHTIFFIFASKGKKKNTNIKSTFMISTELLLLEYIYISNENGYSVQYHELSQITEAWLNYFKILL